MAISTMTKQPYEEFPISINFSSNMDTGETISSQTITIADKDGTDASAAMLSNPQNDGAQIVSVRIEGGSVALSPYKITFKATTDIDNKWEYDVKLKIKEI